MSRKRVKARGAEDTNVCWILQATPTAGEKITGWEILGHYKARLPPELGLKRGVTAG